jgi:hypothetical protein
MQTDPCIEQSVGHRRVFWTTRAQACGSYTLCGVECAIPGLEYENIAEPYPDPDPPGSPGYRTIKTDEWLQSLILNILNTRARNDARCPSPAAIYGHWSESYRDDDLYIGSNLWNAAERPQPYVRTSDAERAVRAAVQADMGKLIVLGLATSVEVDTKPTSFNAIVVTVTVTTVKGRSRINLSGSFVSDTWVWQ